MLAAKSAKERYSIESDTPFSPFPALHGPIVRHDSKYLNILVYFPVVTGDAAKRYDFGANGCKWPYPQPIGDDLGDRKRGRETRRLYPEQVHQTRKAVAFGVMVRS